MASAEDDEAAKLQAELIEKEMQTRQEELQALEELRQGNAAVSPFGPRGALVRTPPKGFSTPTAAESKGEKRLLTSPEDVQEAIRRRVEERRQDTSCVERQPQQEPVEITQQRDEDLARATVQSLAGVATAATKGIMESVRAKTSKLNKDEIAAIGAHTERVSAVITHLTMRLAAAEAKLESLGTQPKEMGAPVAQSFANVIKLPKTPAIQMKAPAGPVLAIYPAPTSENITTAEETKAELKKHVDPTKVWVQVQKVRKVGNAGVVVQTTNEEAATRLKQAVPPSLRVTEPKRRSPLVCISPLEGDPSFEEIKNAVYEQNLKEGGSWTLDRVQTAMKGAFKKRRFGGTATAAVFECTPEIREALLRRSQLYVGWSAVEATDFVDVTCCSKCQLYGHPERYCRAKDRTCGACGETGHTEGECKATARCCATCKKFGRKEASSHRTASRDCPARQHAIERSISSTKYGQ